MTAVTTIGSDENNRIVVEVDPHLRSGRPGYYAGVEVRGERIDKLKAATSDLLGDG